MNVDNHSSIDLRFANVMLFDIINMNYFIARFSLTC